MYKLMYCVVSLMLWAVPSFSAQDLAGAIEGTVKKIDIASKTMVVKTAEGTDHTFHFADRTAVHGSEAAAKGTRAAFHGLREGGEVVVHYTRRGTEQTADEIDYVGKGGLKVGEGIVRNIDRAARTLTVQSASGGEETFQLSERAAQDAGKDIGKGSGKSEKLVVYYTGEAGHKVAHFFKKAL
jgi:hypothetical protein